MKKEYNNLDIKNLIRTEWFKQFDEYQQFAILEGIENNVDVSIYAKPEFNSEQMEQIRLGLDADLDFSIYAKLEFDYRQMNQIREGLEEGLDVQ